MHSTDYNLTLLKEMMAEFDSFILSQELFWPLQRKSFSNTPFPQLSLGALLITLDELTVQRPTMDSHQDRTYQKLLLEFEKFLRRRQAAIVQKAARELKIRTNLWRAYLQDLEEDPDSAEEYVRQVRNRVLMTRLQSQVTKNNLDDELDRFQELDERVMLNAMSVDFVWDERLKSIYPIEGFPFLYVKPR